MRNSSSRLKIGIAVAGFFLILYVLRHFLFAFAIQTFLSHATHGGFEYQNKRWDDGNLTYESVVLGDQLQTAALRFTPDLQLFPFHFSLGIYLTEPHFKLSSEAPTEFNFALFAPTRWSSFKIDIEKGNLSIDEEPIGWVDLISGQEISQLGTWILSLSEGSPFCTCELSYQNSQLFYQFNADQAPALHLQAFMALFNIKTPFQLQGGKLDADLKGVFFSDFECKGSVTGHDLLFSTAEGEFDFRKLHMEGLWSSQLALESHFEGGRFSNGSFLVEEAMSDLSIQPGNPPYLHLQGIFFCGAFQRPFNCEAERDELDLLKWNFQLKDFHLSEKLSCDAIKGEIVLSKSPEIMVEEVSLNMEGLLYSQGAWNLSYERAEVQTVFQKEERVLSWEGHLQKALDRIDVQGQIDFDMQHWKGEFQSDALSLAHYSQFFPPEASIEGHIALQGAFDATGAQAAFTGADTLVHLKEISLPLHIESGVLQWKEEAFSVTQAAGFVALPRHRLLLQIAELKGKDRHFSFSAQIPDEEILITGEFDEKLNIQIDEAKIGQSKVKKALFSTQDNNQWMLDGSATIEADFFQRYVPLIQEAGLWKEMTLSLIDGSLEVEGRLTPEKASLEIQSNGLHLQTAAIPAFKGHLEKDGNIWLLQDFLVGQTQLSAEVLQEEQGWNIRQFSAVSGELKLQGTVKLQQQICSIEANGVWKEASLKGALSWDFNTQEGKESYLHLQQGSFKIDLSCDLLQLKEGKLLASSVLTTIDHPLLKESLVLPVSLSLSSERLLLQGPFSKGTYENHLFRLSGSELHAMYEKGVLHFQTKFQLNETPLKAKGYFLPLEEGKGAVQIFEGSDELRLTFSSFSKISHLEGSLFGVDCSLTRNQDVFEGRLQLKTSDALSQLLQKPEWKQFENLDFSGRFVPEDKSWRFQGCVEGKEAVILGTVIDHLQGAIDYHPTHFEIRQLKIDDAAGSMVIKECSGIRSHPLKAWEVAIPHVKGQKIQPSLLRKKGGAMPQPKAFQIRQLTLTQISGTFGRPLTFRGAGSLSFTQKEKRDPSLFDLPRAFLKEWGLDFMLLMPAYGSADVEFSQGKVIFKALHETFSEGGHSEFFLSEEEPSYIDLKGGLFLNLRMKQNVILKLVEPFTLSVRGSWEKPRYILR